MAKLTINGKIESHLTGNYQAEVSWKPINVGFEVTARLFDDRFRQQSKIRIVDTFIGFPLTSSFLWKIWGKVKDAAYAGGKTAWHNRDYIEAIDDVDQQLRTLE